MNDPDLLALTYEELYLHYLYSYYADNPEELEKAKEEEGLKVKTQEWKGETSDEHEAKMKKILSKIKKVDLSKWQNDVDKGEDEFEDVFTNDQGVSNEEDDSNIGRR